jgi:type IV secretory pathway TrbF-like protein
MTIVPKTATTARNRKALRSLARKGKASSRVIGTTATGFAIGVQVANVVRVVSDRFARQWQAMRWASGKLNTTPRKLLKAA